MLTLLSPLRSPAFATGVGVAVGMGVEVGVGGVVGVGVGLVMVYVAPVACFETFVLEVLLIIADEVKERVAVPAAFALNVMVATVRLLPERGVVEPNAKFILPLLMVFSASTSNTLVLPVAETTSRSWEGYVIPASTPLMVWPFVFTLTCALNVSPLTTLLVAGSMERTLFAGTKVGVATVVGVAVGLGGLVTMGEVGDGAGVLVGFDPMLVIDHTAKSFAIYGMPDPPYHESGENLSLTFFAPAGIAVRNVEKCSGECSLLPSILLALLQVEPSS